MATLTHQTYDWDQEQGACPFEKRGTKEKRVAPEDGKSLTDTSERRKIKNHRLQPKNPVRNSSIAKPRREHEAAVLVKGNPAVTKKGTGRRQRTLT